MNDIKKTHKADPDFLKLVYRLDMELLEMYGDAQLQYNKFNGLESIEQVVLAVCENTYAGCGGYKMYDGVTAEIKRVYVAPEFRGRKLSKAIMLGLEEAARENGYTKSILETGPKQKEAISLYTGLGYRLIENYGPYAGNDDSICFEKELK